MTPPPDISKRQCYTLYDSVNELMALNQINIKKYLPSYLIAAKRAWKKIFRGTLYVTNNVWLTVQAGDPYPYVNLPLDAERVFYAGELDHCGDVKPLYYNNALNVISKPAVKKCGCDNCQCGGLCEDINSPQFSTKILFTINGIDYVEKTWIKYNKNGDILEFREVPTKKYSSGSSGAGDFNNDFNNDFSGGNDSMGNFSIVTETFQRKICALATYPCGCPVDSEENENIVREFCSCFIPLFGHRRRRHCQRFLMDTNMRERGEIKISECGTKLYYRHPRGHHGGDHKKQIPDFILVSYQTNGEPALINDQIQVPDFAVDAMWAGTFNYIKKFNPKYNKTEKDDARWLFNSELNDIITYLSPLSFQDMSDVQDAPIKW